VRARATKKPKHRRFGFKKKLAATYSLNAVVHCDQPIELLFGLFEKRAILQAGPAEERN